MIRALLLNLIIVSLLVTMPTRAAGQPDISPEQIIQQELLLNGLIANLHLLTLDFQDKHTRQQLNETVAQLDKNLRQLPETVSNTEAQQLLSSSKALWPVISEHMLWLIKLPGEADPPNIDSLVQALIKLDRQLLILRQIVLTENPKASHPLRFLEQALLMQKMTREYLSLSTTTKKITSQGRHQQLQSMAEQFNKRMVKIEKEFRKHPHANRPARKAGIAWHFIAKSIDRFPEQPVPSMVVLYNDKIISQLSSIHNMF